MKDHKGDGNKFGIMILLIMVAFLVLSSSGSSSKRHSSGHVFSSGTNSNQINTVPCKAVSLPELQKFCQNADPGKAPLPYSVTSKISLYNLRIDRCFHLVQATRLRIKPGLLQCFHFRFDPHEDDYPPHLS